MGDVVEVGVGDGVGLVPAVTRMLTEVVASRYKL